MPAVFAFAFLIAADAPAEQFVRAAAPMLAARCGECHGAKKAEGELDFAALLKPELVRRNMKVWQHAAELVESGQMPPQGARPLPPAEKANLLAALKALLRNEAEKHAGDPGPVPLRRLSNVEYAWTLRDLTGVAALDPARDFPADGAAGEGFANAGAALAMSPVLVERYLAAAKGVAEHAALLPDGFVFAPGTTPRDWTDERLAAIKALHARYATADGKLPLAHYIAALVERRSADAADIAAERGLSVKYLSALHAALTAVDGPHANPLLAPFRQRFPALKPSEAPAFAAELDAWSAALARTQNVGHRKPWLVEVDPLVRVLPIKQEVPADGTLTLAAHGLGGVAFRNARLAIPGRNEPIAWTDIPAAAAGFAAWRSELLRHADAALELAAELSADERLELPPAAAKRGVPLPVAQAWLAALGLAPGQAAPVGTLFKTPLKNGGNYAFIQGWGSPDLPSLLANSSAQEVRVPGKMRPKSVAVHPTPTLHAAVAWRSPFAGTVQVEAAIAHAHIECGNGVAWTLELRRGQRRQRLAAGIAHGRKIAAAGPFPALAVRPGDALVLLVGPRDGNHSCDLTDVELRIAAAGPGGKTWSLAEDVAPDVLQGNPHPDRHGAADVWSFFAEPVDPANADRGVPAGSLLAKWQNAATDAERRGFGKALAMLLAVPPTDASPDAALARQLRAPGGPLLSGCDWRKAPTPPAPVAVPKSFPFRSETRLEAPEAARHDLPAEWFAGAVFHAEAVARVGAVQVEANGRAGAPTRALRPGLPILAADDAEAARLRAACAEFRALFPRGVCYAPVVPVDEVVTLELFHRDDEPLRRLLLDAAEAQRLDRLWEELRWVAREPPASSAAFVHLMEYATQDSNPKLFEHHRQPIAAADAAFRQALKDAEPRQWAALAAFVPRAWRRPVAAAELAGLRRLYDRLRGEKLAHEDAFRLTLARVLSAPAFLYKLERAADGPAAKAVDDHELAVRLSYFLWSSCPDDELRTLADANRLRDPARLAAQARRLLADPKAKRLAEEFGGGWLQLTDFAKSDEKSPRHFPTFAALRGDLHEEVVRGFEDFFRNDRPVAALLDANAGFVNEALARHYGMTGVQGPEFRRVEGLRKLGRGGILGQAAALAKHAGASQTSPALRGAWVSEALLGEKLPKPPKDVPPLPTEAAAAGLSVRQLAEKHVSDQRCAGCHRRFDAFGFALEGFDAIGRQRSGPLNLAVTTPDGVALDGLDGLRRYLLTARRADFERQFCRKLLGYALGRGVILSDEPLLDHMRSELAKADGRVSAAVLAIVGSPQFRELRGRGHRPDPE